MCIGKKIHMEFLVQVFYALYKTTKFSMKLPDDQKYTFLHFQGCNRELLLSLYYQGGKVPKMIKTTQMATKKSALAGKGFCENE